MASFNFFKFRTVDWQKRNWARLSVTALELVGTGAVPLIAVTLEKTELVPDAGGGVADLQKPNERSRVDTPNQHASNGAQR